MRRIIIAVILILATMDMHSQNKPADRKPYAAGRFYSDNPETLRNDLTALFSECKKSVENQNVRAIIAPHAGYVFSGRIAASAFSATPKNAAYKNIFIIGSSHVMAFDGASIFDSGDYVTPLGNARVNTEIASALKNSSKVFAFSATAHDKEHSIEVQVPFIQYYYSRQIPIIPIIIGTNNAKIIKLIAEALKPYFTPDNLFVISSDFSHYPSYDNAVKNDKATADAILSGSPETFLETLRKNAAKNTPDLATSMCGWTSGLTLLYLSEGDSRLSYTKIDYCNSGDSQYGDKDQCVGYNAIILSEKKASTENTSKSPQDVSFTEDEKKMLFKIARNAIRSRFPGEKPDNDLPEKFSPALSRKFGAFVTLKINGTLRGCIGRFVSEDPLYDVVRQSAISSAFEDPRFPELTKDEYKKVVVEITVLGPMKKISNINEIILGKHGIYIKKGFQSGTMLPQVPIEYGWTLEQFLGYTSRDKAGLGWDGWKNAEISIYEGLVLEENGK